MKVAYVYQTQTERDENVYGLRPARFGQFDPHDPTNFIVGYLARHAGLTSIPLPPQWVWHRVNALDVANKSITLNATPHTPAAGFAAMPVDFSWEHTIRLSFDTQDEFEEAVATLENHFVGHMVQFGNSTP